MAAFLDLRAMDAGTELTAELCIIGAGAAGITLAKELAGTRQDILLVESGGLDMDAETNALGEGQNVGMTYVPLESARLRVFGGTTSHWTGWCTPLRPIDFIARPWMPLSGWPFTIDELLPYYKRAQVLCELGPFVYDKSLWAEIGEPLDSFDPAKFEFVFWQKGPPTRFGERYRADIQQAPNVRVLLHANVVNIGTDPNASTATQLDLKATNGKTATVRAKRFVLACGTIQNARLLLASNKVVPQGLGNTHDWVGRCFAEHPSWRVGEVYTDDPFRLVDRYHTRIIDGRPHRIALAPTDATDERLELQDNCVGFQIDFVRGARLPAYRKFWKSVLHGEMPRHIGESIWSMLTNLGDVTQSAWRRTVLGKDTTQEPKSIGLSVSLSPRPNPDSRVTLADQTDPIGMPLPRLNWRIMPEDAQSMARLAKLFAGELARLGLARVQLHPGLDDPSGAWALAGNLVGSDVDEQAPEMLIAWHHMGTARMTDDPTQGVVDRNCRVHGIDNLYVVGGSAFTTAGFANPTLSIVALAVRLADHLREGAAS